MIVTMARRTEIPKVDPTRRPLRVRLIEPLALTGAARWWVIHVAPPIDRALFRLSGGRFGSLPLNMLFLTHTGARSGKQRETPLLYFTDGEDAVVMASNYGREGHPAWYYNVKANPEVEVLAGGYRGRFRASIATGEDRERLWGLAKQLTRAYANYEERAANREIQVIRLTPVSDAEPAAAASSG